MGGWLTKTFEAHGQSQDQVVANLEAQVQAYYGNANIVVYDPGLVHDGVVYTSHTCAGRSSTPTTVLVYRLRRGRWYATWDGKRTFW